MPLTDRQKQELNIAILDYFRDHGFTESLELFARECQLSPPQNPMKMLEKKWTAVVRLTSKLAQLEKRLSTTEVRLKQVQPFQYSDFAGPKKMFDEVIPNAAKFKLRGHQKAVNRVLFHPNFSWLITCGDDGKIGVWDYETGKLEKWLRGHTNSICDLSFNMNGTMLASSSADMSIKVWNFDDEFRCIKTLNGHDHSVTGVSFFTLNDVDVVISCSRDGTVKIWDLVTGYCTNTMGDLHDGEWVKKVIVSYEGSLFATCSVDQTVRVFDAKKFSEVQVFRGHDHVVEDVKFSHPNADEVITGGGIGGSSVGGYNNNNNNNNNNYSNNSKRPRVPSYGGDDGSDSDEEIRRKQKPPRYLASASRDKTICIWDIQTGHRIMTLQGHENWVRSLVFHPCGRYLFSSADDKSVRVWDLSKQREHSKLEDAHAGFVASIDWHPKESLLASGATTRDVNIWYHDPKKDDVVDF